MDTMPKNTLQRYIQMFAGTEMISTLIGIVSILVRHVTGEWPLNAAIFAFCLAATALWWRCMCLRRVALAIGCLFDIGVCLLVLPFGFVQITAAVAVVVLLFVGAVVYEWERLEPGL